MRKLGLVFIALVLLLAASFVSTAAASASITTSLPGPPGPHSGVRPTTGAAPRGAIRSPATAAAAVTCDGQFDVVASPNGTGNNYLNSISAVSANDVWAVGSSTSASNLDRTLAEHWNGTSWSIVPTVSPGPGHNDLFGVSGVSSNDVWAVGAYETNHTTGASATLAEHWNGSSWTRFATPNPTSYSYLFAVTAVSSSSVWAVGTVYNFAIPGYIPMVDHFDGVSWSYSLPPGQGLGNNQLFAVSALSDSEIWAVGSYEPTFGGTRQSFADYWDGSQWHMVLPPDTANGDNEILGVTGLEAGHALGVGYGGNPASTTPRQAIAWDLHYPTVSTSVALSTSVSGDVVLEAVDRASESVWAVGFTRVTNSSPRQTLVRAATWDSTAHSLTWAASPGISANPGGINSVLFGVAAISPGVFWAAGYENNGAKDQTLTELYCGLHFTVGGPATASAGAPFALTVSAKNADNSTDTAYRGTVNFTSSDSQAVLPGNYTFTLGDAGVHTFTGVVLKSPYHQPSTITVSDTVTPFVTGSAIITVHCDGVCQSSGGTPAARGTSPGPGGSPGSRGDNQSPTAPPGPRVPLRQPVRGASAGSGSDLAIGKVFDRASIAAARSNRTRDGAQAKPTQATSLPAVMQGGHRVQLMQTDKAGLMSQRIIGSSRPAEPSWTMALLFPGGLLLFALLAVRRPRSGEE